MRRTAWTGRLVPTLSEERISYLLQPYLHSGDSREGTLGREQPPAVLSRLSLYLDLLLRWNERTNLTAIKDPEQIVTRHFGESLFAAEALRTRLKDGSTVLDLGTGAGFPGLPLQILLPTVRVTLAESQGKKAAFLREAVRVMGLESQVWAGRAQDLPDSERFEAVTLRAVDRPDQALAEARRRLKPGGWLVHLRGEPSPQLIEVGAELLAIPGLHRAVVELRQV